MNPLLIADTSPIIGFVAARQHHILIAVSQARWGGTILVPEHVHEEALRVTERISRKASDTYNWMVRRGHIERLADNYGELPDDDILTDALYDLLDLGPFGYSPNQKDLGEALAVAYATHFDASGQPCLLLIDDGQGVRWAIDRNLPTIGTINVLEYAIQDGAITSRQQLKDAHRDISVHSWLPALPSGMLGSLPH